MSEMSEKITNNKCTGEKKNNKTISRLYKMATGDFFFSLTLFLLFFLFFWQTHEHTVSHFHWYTCTHVLCRHTSSRISITTFRALWQHARTHSHRRTHLHTQFRCFVCTYMLNALSPPTAMYFCLTFFYFFSIATTMMQKKNMEKSRKLLYIECKKKNGSRTFVFWINSHFFQLFFWFYVFHHTNHTVICLVVSHNCTMCKIQKLQVFKTKNKNGKMGKW